MNTTDGPTRHIFPFFRGNEEIGYDPRFEYTSFNGYRNTRNFRKVSSPRKGRHPCQIRTHPWSLRIPPVSSRQLVRSNLQDLGWGDFVTLRVRWRDRSQRGGLYNPTPTGSPRDSIKDGDWKRHRDLCCPPFKETRKSSLVTEDY